MKNVSLICAMAAVAAFAGPAHAIFKCTTAKGVVYQDRPCREGSEADVRIVIPTGEIAPRVPATPDDGTSVNGAPVDSRAIAPSSGCPSADDPVSGTKPAERKSGGAAPNGADGSRRNEARTNLENAPSADRRTSPQDRSYRQVLRDRWVWPGDETPAQMNCESPTGEKRMFYLSNGKLTSI